MSNNAGEILISKWSSSPLTARELVLLIAFSALWLLRYIPHCFAPRFLSAMLLRPSKEIIIKAPRVDEGRFCIRYTACAEHPDCFIIEVMERIDATCAGGALAILQYLHHASLTSTTSPEDDGSSCVEISTSPQRIRAWMPPSSGNFPASQGSAHRNQDGHFGWTKSISGNRIDYPHDKGMSPKLGDVYVHENESDGRIQAWVYGKRGDWSETRPGDPHPRTAHRVFHLGKDGIPAWIAGTSNFYFSRRA
ncbi:hypothetical protein EVG20_g3214 [Dentipellis fragilis]|uniref:Uncharacterized protein n=1 Tax=Dentipellis fragilis TaxID=205917 RepID=A0A4Y9Z5E8_9AGAM|nr:hypothetical protein EVG20_g3214 [Dentipellis fragilis]